MSVLVALAFFPSLAIGIILVVKFREQIRRDANRKTYVLSFPHDLDSERVNAWVRSISGTMHYGTMSFLGTSTLAFEMYASNHGIKHTIRVPWQHADYIVSQLRALVPGIRVTPEDEWEHHKWTRAVEVCLTHSARQLRIASPTDLSASLLASVGTLQDKEAMVVQWVVTPAAPSHPPVHDEAKSHEFSLKMLTKGNLASKDEVNDRRGKLTEPNVLAVLRVGAVASTSGRAEHLIYRVRASLATTHGPATKFVKRHAGNIQERLDTAATPLVFPMQLTASELTALVAWPIGNPFVAGLPQTMARHLPTSEQVPREGRIIGRSNFPGNERLVALGYDEALKHMHVVGPTGSGKTALLANMIKQDMVNGYGVVLIEAKGDLFHAALDYIPPGRLSDVIILDVRDTARPVGFNILQQGNPRVVIDELTALFEHMYDSKSVWTREVLYHGLRTLAQDPKFTFPDLATLLVPMSSEENEWCDSLTRNLQDKELKNFWQRFENESRASQDRIVKPGMDRIWQLNARPEIRNIIGQSESSFQMRDVVQQNKILLINLSGVPKETASLTGTLLMGALWDAVKSVRGSKPTYLFMDEFQDFVHLPIDPEDMLVKARGFGLGMVLAHQHLDQLPKSLEHAVMNSARTKVVLQTNASDASAMAREFGTLVEPHDFQYLGAYEVLVRVNTPTGMSAPLTLATYPPVKGFGRGREVVNWSRERFGRPLEQVQTEIEARRIPASTPRANKPKPRISSWGQQRLWLGLPFVTTLHLVPDDIQGSYECHEWRNGAAVLREAHPSEWDDLIAMLRAFTLPRSWIINPGGNRSQVSAWVDDFLCARGWVETGFQTAILVDEHRRDSPTHKVDCFKNSVGLEVEWNNKDPFYDRDLNNFRLLFELRVIDVGIIFTRCDELQQIFAGLGRGASYGMSTTHMSKLLPRIEGGAGGGCPLLVFGISAGLYDEAN